MKLVYSTLGLLPLLLLAACASESQGPTSNSHQAVVTGDCGDPEPAAKPWYCVVETPAPGSGDASLNYYHYDRYEDACGVVTDELGSGHLDTDDNHPKGDSNQSYTCKVLCQPGSQGVGSSLCIQTQAPSEEPSENE